MHNKQSHGSQHGAVYLVGNLLCSARARISCLHPPHAHPFLTGTFRLIRQLGYLGIWRTYLSKAMAEIIGVVASGISIAQVAGKILSTGLEIKCLLDDMTEIPGRLADLLDQVTLLAAIISEISLDDDFMPASYQASQNRSLRNAVTYCQKAADQLAELASSLSAQVQTTRGFKRKLGLAKAVLRKEQLAKLENRLSTAVQLLSLAQQTYMLYDSIVPSVYMILVFDSKL